MLDAPQLDPLGSLVTELRADADVAALVGTTTRAKVRVWGEEYPSGEAPGSDRDTWHAYVVVVGLFDPPMDRMPATIAQYALRCYGVTPQNAREVWGACVKALHSVGPRVKSSGLGIYRSRVIAGGTPDRDPDTSQPYVVGTIMLIASTQVVTV